MNEYGKALKYLNVEFRDDVEVALDLFDKLTHMDCYDGNVCLILPSGTYKDTTENFGKILH